MAEINAFYALAEPYVETEFEEKNGNLKIYLEPLLDKSLALTAGQWDKINNWWDHIEPINWRDLIDKIIEWIIDWITELLD